MREESSGESEFGEERKGGKRNLNRAVIDDFLRAVRCVRVLCLIDVRTDAVFVLE